MDDRYKEIFAKKYPNKKTYDNYLSRVKGLMKHMDSATLQDVLKNPDTYYPKLQQAYKSITTRKNALTVILVLYREDTELQASHPNEYKQWKKLHDDLGKIQDARIRRSEPEQKQIDKYTSFEEIEAKYRELGKRTFHDTERHSMQFVLVSIIVHLRPKRADLGNIEIFKENDPRKTDQNYIVLRKTGASYLVMNMYKTSKYYQTVEEELPEGLVKDIQTSLKRWPRTHLFRKDDKEPMSNNTYSAFVKQTFRDLFGRSTGVSLLRHIYITEKLNLDDMTLEEQGEEAKLMLHTSGLQRQYKWPKKTLCPKLCMDYIQKTCKTRRVKRTPLEKNSFTKKKERLTQS